MPRLLSVVLLGQPTPRRRPCSVPPQAVNFGPAHWLPYGTDCCERYRATGKPLTLRCGV